MSSTIAVDYVQTRQFLPHRKATVAAEIWDTAGQEQFRSVTRYAMCGCMSVIDGASRKNEFVVLDLQSFLSRAHGRYGSV